jgi:hypothetical protein
MVEKHFNISIAPVRSRGGSLVIDIVAECLFFVLFFYNSIFKKKVSVFILSM